MWHAANAEIQVGSETDVPIREPVANMPTRLVFADAIRGLAAFWVVLFHLHAARQSDTVIGLLPDFVERFVFRAGHLGVSAFFVLSGFVMALNVHGARADAGFASRFLTRRFLRLTPPYYAAIVLCIVYGMAQRLLLEPATPLPGVVSLAAHAAYLQDLVGVPPISGVFWTLCVEVQFYLVFAVLLLIAARLPIVASVNSRALLLLITAIPALAWPAGVIGADHPESSTFFPYWYSFAAGALTCWAWMARGPLLVLTLVFLGGVVCIAAVCANAFATVAAMTSLILLAAALSGGMTRWFDWGWAQFLGRISYSLYLIHNLAIGAVFFVARQLLPPGLLREALCAPLALMVAVLLSWFLYRWVELPSIQWSRRLSARMGGSRL